MPWSDWQPAFQRFKQQVGYANASSSYTYSESSSALIEQSRIDQYPGLAVAAGPATSGGSTGVDNLSMTSSYDTSEFLSGPSTYSAGIILTMGWAALSASPDFSFPDALFGLTEGVDYGLAPGHTYEDDSPYAEWSGWDGTGVAPDGLAVVDYWSFDTAAELVIGSEPTTQYRGGDMYLSYIEPAVPVVGPAPTPVAPGSGTVVASVSGNGASLSLAGTTLTTPSKGSKITLLAYHSALVGGAFGTMAGQSPAFGAEASGSGSFRRNGSVASFIHAMLAYPSYRYWKPGAIPLRRAQRRNIETRHIQRSTPSDISAPLRRIQRNP